MLIDTHCHLDAPEFACDRAEVVARARAAGIDCMVVPAVTAATFPQTLAVAREFRCPFALRMHPIYLRSYRPQQLNMLREWIEHENPVAIGEIGLDFFVTDLDVERQIEMFVEQLKIAHDYDLPVLLHIRRAQDQILKALRRVGVRGGIAHAFNGSRQQADAFIKLGFKLGFGGAMTFSRALNLRRLAVELPLETIVLETDAPDLAPEWIHRQRNEPMQLSRIATELARLRGIPVEVLAAATRANAVDVLNIHDRL